MTRIVLFIFAGREENMRIQWPYLERLLDLYPTMEVHLWDLTRRASDAAYLKTLARERVRVADALHPGHPIRCLYPVSGERPRGYPACKCIKHVPPYEKPYQWYARDPAAEPGTIYVKVDDDVLFLETERFGDLIAPVIEDETKITSAAVINNAVCAKYESGIRVEYDGFLGDPENPANDQAWWALHMSPEFAWRSHWWFLHNWKHILQAFGWRVDARVPIKTRKGEAISINCIAFSQHMMEVMGEKFKSNPRLGDEGVVDSFLPWIVPTFHAAHLAFGPQEKHLDPMALHAFREGYARLSKEYLS